VFDALSGDDNVVSTYRDHGHALARGVPMVSLAAEMLGKVSGCRRGRGGSMHLFDVGRRFFGGNAITDTLSGDHRVTSGHEGSLFLEALVAALGEEEL